MSKKYRVYQVDSFTKELFKGNPAGVVANADGLTVEQMQNIARELNNSETAFILNPTGSDHDVWIRFFTPYVEVPICGHATIAAHFIRALENNYESKTVIQKTGAGILPVEIVRNDSGYKITMTQGEIVFEPPLNKERCKELRKALRLEEEEFYNECPIQIVSTGHSKVMIGIKTQKALDELKPDMQALASISKEIKCNGYFVFTFDTSEEDILTKGRMFAPAIGINEDPVTGNANGPLGAYLVKHKLVKAGGSKFQFTGKQGEAIKRPGVIDVEVEIENEEPKKIKIRGNAVVVFKTEIEL